MATLYWLGNAPAVKQVSTVQITAVDGTPANTTYTITIGDVDVSVAGDTDVNTTATNLNTALKAEPHEYFLEGTTITFTVATDTVTMTAFVAGVPFVAASSVSGGTGTIGAVATGTASAGPADWSTGKNWYVPATATIGTIPADTDTVVIEGNSNNIAYGLDQNGQDLAFLRIDASYTGLIGLDRKVFATTADGATTNTTIHEYRAHYLKLGAEFVDIGDINGPGTSAGSSRIKLHNSDPSASTTVIHGTKSAGEGSNPAVMLLMDHASSTLQVKKAPGGVGIASEEPGETSSFATITVSDETLSAQVFTGEGLTLVTWVQNGGNNSLKHIVDGVITTMTVNGGTLETSGDFTVTTLNVNDGTANIDHERISGVAVTTANLNGGTTNTRGSSTGRTWTTVNLGIDASFSGDSNLTITTLNEPTDPYKIDISEP